MSVSASRSISSFPRRSSRGHVAKREGYTASPTTRPMGVGLDLRGRRRDGSEFPVEISLSPLQTDEGLLVTSVVRDITARQEAEARIRALNVDLEARVAELATVS